MCLLREKTCDEKRGEERKGKQFVRVLIVKKQQGEMEKRRGMAYHQGRAGL